VRIGTSFIPQTLTTQEICIKMVDQEKEI